MESGGEKKAWKTLHNRIEEIFHHNYYESLILQRGRQGYCEVVGVTILLVETLNLKRKSMIKIMIKTGKVVKLDEELNFILNKFNFI